MIEKQVKSYILSLKVQTSCIAKLFAKALHSFSPTTRSGHYFVSPILTGGYTI